MFYFFLYLCTIPVQPNTLQDFYINYFSRTNWWNSLIFGMLVQIYTTQKKTEHLWGLAWSKNECGQSGDGTLKLTVSEEWPDRINWFFACWYRFSKIKSWSNFLRMGMVKNGSCQSVHRTLKLTVSQKNEQMEQTVFLHAGTNSENQKVDSMIFGWVCSNNCSRTFFFFQLGLTPCKAEQPLYKAGSYKKKKRKKIKAYRKSV